MKKHPAPRHKHPHPATETEKTKPIQGLSAAHSKAVLECARTITSIAPIAPSADVTIKVPKEPKSLVRQMEQLQQLQSKLAHAKTPKAAKMLQGNIAKLERAPRMHFWNQLQAIEDQTNVNLYTPARYQTQLDRAKYYTDIYVDSLPKENLAADSKKALKAQFHAIIEGTAGMETGWDPKVVMGSAVWRPHTGVFQASWEFINQARGEFRQRPVLENALNTDNGKQDLDVLELSSHLKVASGLPTTSFAGQGAAFAAMAVASYERFIANGGKQKDFNGIIVYEDHMTGPTGAIRFRDKLEGTQHKGDSGIADAAYAGNYLKTATPYVGLNDFNPERLVHSQATASDVYTMLRDKFIQARNRLDANTGLFSGRVKAFEAAFLPEWGANPQLKEQEIARVNYQRDEGHKMRDQAKAYALEQAMEQYNKQHKKQEPITLKQAQEMQLTAPAHPNAAQKQAVCDILLKPITPYNPQTPTLKR